MAPIKFEEQIKDKLEKRTVAPSADAWSKLSQQLDAEDKRNKKSTFWWFGVAASIAALVFVTLTYFGNSTDTETKDIIVKEDIKELVEPTKTEEEILTNNDQAAEESLVQAAPVKEDPKPQVQAVKKLKKQNKALAVIKPDVVIPVDRTNREKQAKEGITKIEAIEFNAVTEVLKEAEKQKELIVTDQQIDSLLKEANRELLIDRALKSKSNIVDADALLQDVEEEMGQSFRTRIYETLKDSYKSVKSAVARRNN